MKKTISVNIKGFHFLIEEEGYNFLQKYLDDLKYNLSGVEGSEDILEDIEIRIAELCQNALQNGKQVVESEDVKAILKTLGKPEDYIEFEENEHATQYENSDSQKRLFRSDDDAMIGGVCAGISSYIKLDLTVVRLLFVLFMFMGFGFILYIILWIILPKANSTIDRLKMKGQPITVESIREEVEKAAERVTKEGKRVSNSIRSEFKNNNRFSTLGKMIRYAIGTAIILFAFILSICLIIFFFADIEIIPIDGENGFLSLTEAMHLLFSESDSWWILFFGFTAAISFILLNYNIGISFFTRIRNKWIKAMNITFILLVIIGVTGGFIIGMKVLRDFSIDQDWENEIAIIDSDELVLTTNPEKQFLNDGLQIREKDHHMPIFIRKNKIFNVGFEITCRESKDSLFHVYQSVGAHGRSTKQAIKRAKNIDHTIEVSGNEIIAKSHYSYPQTDLIRAQFSEIIIEIPKGKALRIRNDMQEETVQIGFTREIKGEITEEGVFNRY